MKRLQRFFNSDVFGGIFLIITAAVAMLLANTKATRDLYYAFLNIPIEFKVSILEISKNMLIWINDALMTIFFLLVGLEIKREFIEGLLINCQQAIFPVITAIGGMIVPALIYLVFNFHNPVTRNGWAIPAATDIAFALGILALLGSRVPASLRIFLMAIAMIDDLGAIIIIALFYTSKISMLPLWIIMVAITILLVFNLCNIRCIGVYMLVGVILWAAVLKSGIHPTLAGVIVGLFVPFKSNKAVSIKEQRSPAQILENTLRPWVVFLILPLFAFANAGISLQGVTAVKLTSTLMIGIVAGLLVGKPLGISLFCWLMLKLKLATLPQGTTFKQIMAIGVLCGVGFTMSIFVSTLAFGNNVPEFVLLAKFGILTGSSLAAVLGYILLRRAKLCTQEGYY